MCLYRIGADYNGPLGCDMIECSAAGQPTRDLSYQLRGCSIAFMYTIRLRSDNVFVSYWPNYNGTLGTAHERGILIEVEVGDEARF